MNCPRVSSKAFNDIGTNGHWHECNWTASMQHPAWILVIFGLLAAVIGALWMLLPAGHGLGRLPGDIAIERENFRFYFPLTTSILLSLVLTAIVWLVRYFSR